MFIKGALIALVVLSYFVMIRPARQYYTTNLVAPQVGEWIDKTKSSSDSEVLFESKSSKSFYITFSLGGITKEIIYSPQVGFFLLLAVIGLICITLKWQYYLFLLILHLVFELVAIFTLWIGVVYSSIGFIIVDFIISYLSPLLSLGMIPVVMFYSKRDTILKDYL